MMTPRQDYFTAPNLVGGGTHQIAYLDWDDGRAENTIICVHGLTRNKRDFDYVARELAAAGNRVMALDMAGRGDSDNLPDASHYNYATYMQDCIAFMDNFHLRSVDWVGTSMGGIIGMMIASMNPGRIKRMVLNDIGAFISGDALKRIVTYVNDSANPFASRAQAEAQLRHNLETFGVDSDEAWRHLFAYSIIEQDDGTARFAFDARILEPIRSETNNLEKLDNIDLSELWTSIDIPVLILRGEHSDILSPETVSAMRAKNLRCSAVEIPGVGHAPALIKPQEYRHITQWLSSFGSAAWKTRAI